MRKYLFYLLLLTLNYYCQPSEQSKLQTLAKEFLKKVEAKDYNAAKSMMKADLKSIAKNEELFEHDMKMIGELIEKNGFPKELTVEEKPRTYIDATVNIDLGKPNIPFTEKLILYIDFMNGDLSNIYGYRLDRVMKF